MGKLARVGNRDYVSLKIGKKELRATINWSYTRIGGFCLPELQKKSKPQLLRLQNVLEGLTSNNPAWAPCPWSTIRKEKPGQHRRNRKTVDGKLEFSPADLKIGSNKMPRWRKTLHFTVYHRLKDSKFIAILGKGQWMITDKGLNVISKDPSISGPEAQGFTSGQLVITKSEE